MANFGAFGVGMGTPLLAFGFLSEPWHDRVLGVLTGHRRAVNAITGFLLLAISVYYLIFVFGVGEGCSETASLSSQS